MASNAKWYGKFKAKPIIYPYKAKVKQKGCLYKTYRKNFLAYQAKKELAINATKLYN